MIGRKRPAKANLMQWLNPVSPAQETIRPNDKIASPKESLIQQKPESKQEQELLPAATPTTQPENEEAEKARAHDHPITADTRFFMSHRAATILTNGPRTPTVTDDGNTGVVAREPDVATTIDEEVVYEEPSLPESILKKQLASPLAIHFVKASDRPAGPLDDPVLKPQVVKEPQEPAFRVNAASFHPAVEDTSVVAQPVPELAAESSLTKAAEPFKTPLNPADVVNPGSRVSVAGSNTNFEDEIVGAGSDDGFDSHETVEWLGATPFDAIKVMVPKEQLQVTPNLSIDPATGEFEEALDYPHAYPNPEKLDIELENKKVHFSSDFHLQREILARRNLANRVRRQEENARLLAPPTAAPTTVEAPDWPKADCKIRPATEEHFAAIAEIMRLEAKATNRIPQVLDSCDITIKDIARIDGVCQTRFRPFIVAITEPVDLTDSSKWPQQDRGEYAKYMTWKRKQPKEKPVVVGFAYVTDPKIGFLNKSDPGARYVGSIRLCVHPNHRRKQYGKALLDRILLSTAPYHRSLIDHEWVEQSEGNLIHEDLVWHNQRQYSQLFIEVNTARADKDAKWKRDMLNYFDFERAASFPKMLRTDRGEKSEDLDLEIWRIETKKKLLDAPPGQFLAPRTSWQ